MATYNKETFKRLFQSKFNLSKWQMLLQDYFHADKVRVSPEVLDEDAEDRKGYFLGSMTTQDNYELGFFYLCTQNQVTWIWLIGVKVYY